MIFNPVQASTSALCTAVLPFAAIMLGMNWGDHVTLNTVAAIVIIYAPIYFLIAAPLALIQLLVAILVRKKLSSRPALQQFLAFSIATAGLCAALVVGSRPWLYAVTLRDWGSEVAAEETGFTNLYKWVSAQLSMSLAIALARMVASARKHPQLPSHSSPETGPG